MNIGKRIRKLREKHGMMQTALARRLGVDKNTVYRYERGLNSPSLDMLQNIARALDEPMVAFFTEEPADPLVGAGKPAD